MAILYLQDHCCCGLFIVPRPCGQHHVGWVRGYFNVCRCDPFQRCMFRSYYIMVVRQSGKLPLWLSYTQSLQLVCNQGNPSVIKISNFVFTVIWMVIAVTVYNIMMFSPLYCGYSDLNCFYIAESQSAWLSSQYIYTGGVQKLTVVMITFSATNAHDSKTK